MLKKKVAVLVGQGRVLEEKGAPRSLARVWLRTEALSYSLATPQGCLLPFHGWWPLFIDGHLGTVR